MSDQAWASRALFAAALEQPQELQEEFVLNASAPEAVVREVLELLRFHHKQDDEFLEPTELLDAQIGGGARRLGDYMLEERIASGGMGVVYRGRDTRLNRAVAIKLLHPTLSDTEDARDRMVHEARVAAKLQHEGIVQVFDVVDTKSDVAIVSHLVKGETLEAMVKARESALCLPDDVTLIKSIAEALQHAHDAGVVHRDVKPSNILIEHKSGQPKLTDFGIAKLLTQTVVLHTSAGGGTVFYMSPEQTLQDSEQISPASDIFSLGIVFYELLTGQKPFVGPTRDVIVSQIRQGMCEPPRALNPKVPRDLELVCLKMLEVEQRFRYQSCQDLADDLNRYLQGVPVTATAPSLSRRVRTLVVTRRQFLSRAGMLAVGVAGGGYAAVRVLDKRSILRVQSADPAQSIEVYRWIPHDFRFELVSRGSGKHHSSRLGEGIHRITLRYKNGVREFDRMLQGDSDSVELKTSVPTLNHANMIDVALPPDYPGQRQVDQDFQNQVQHVQPFRIDVTEVSCGEYNEFLQATGRPSPSIWGDQLNPAWVDLPVTQVTFTDANDFAEWAGKRLPTISEWMLAACGPYGELYPWGEINPFDEHDPVNSVGVPFPEYGNWGQVDQRAKSRLSGTEGASYFEENAWPVASSSLDVRDGVKNIKGNVAEWTSTPLYVPDAYGEWRVSYGYRHICGHSWADQREIGRMFPLISGSGDSIGGAVLDRGFRCAISM